MRRVLLTVLTALLVAGALAPAAGAHYTAGCRHKRCKLHMIRPYVDSFLRPVGRCESARRPGGYSLHAGLRVVSSGGTYRGRYQFDMGAWHGAGGTGDPIHYGWVEQAYRAVVWLHINGRQSWPNC